MSVTSCLASYMWRNAPVSMAACASSLRSLSGRSPTTLSKRNSSNESPIRIWLLVYVRSWVTDGCQAGSSCGVSGRGVGGALSGRTGAGSAASTRPGEDPAEGPPALSARDGARAASAGPLPATWVRAASCALAVVSATFSVRA